MRSLMPHCLCGPICASHTRFQGRKKHSDKWVSTTGILRREKHLNLNQLIHTQSPQGPPLEPSTVGWEDTTQGAESQSSSARWARGGSTANVMTPCFDLPGTGTQAKAASAADTFGHYSSLVPLPGRKTQVFCEAMCWQFWWTYVFKVCCVHHMTQPFHM